MDKDRESQVTKVESQGRSKAQGVGETNFPLLG